MFNIFKNCKLKKCKLLESSFSPREDSLGRSFAYNAQVVMPLGEQLSIMCDVDETNSLDFSKVNFRLQSEQKESTRWNLLIESKVNHKTGIAQLSLIEVPEELRGNGLGTIAFKLWIDVLEYLEDYYNFQIVQLIGVWGTGGDFTPEISLKLYQHYDKYKCFGTSRLRLIKEGLKNNEIKYLIYRK